VFVKGRFTVAEKGEGSEEKEENRKRGTKHKESKEKIYMLIQREIKFIKVDSAGNQDIIKGSLRKNAH
jgi:hypothetical protein